MPDAGHSRLADITAHNPFLGNRLDVDTTLTVTSAAVGDRVVRIELSDGTDAEFHFQWLRHSCYCDSCGNPADGIRFATVASFESAVALGRVEVDGGVLCLTWDDGHESRFAGDWLRSHDYGAEGRDRRSTFQPTTWRCELTDDFPTVPWDDAAKVGEGRLRLYDDLLRHGIVRITGVGAEPDGTEELASLLGPIPETTVYGRIYDVRAEPIAKLGAKTGMPQAPHIDDAFCYSPPGIDVFHCLAQTEDGGRSTYVDGFAVAEAIAEEAPEAYRLLTSVAVSHIRRHPGEIDMRHRGPLISLDEDGRPRGIRYFDRALAPLDVDPELVEPMYDAIREFNWRMVDPAFIADIRVAPGDGVFIDNHRVMHGRTAFDPAAGRHIRLCHVPRDEFHGRWRELVRRLRPTDHDLRLPQGSI